MTLPQACILLAAALPRRVLTLSDALDVVRHTQLSNHKAKLSHYRRRLKRRDKP